MFPNPSHGSGGGASGNPFAPRSGGINLNRSDPTGASQLDPTRGPQGPLSPSQRATQAFTEGHVPSNPQNDHFMPRNVAQGLTGRAEMPGNGLFNPNYPGIPDERRNIFPPSGQGGEGGSHVNRPLMPGAGLDPHHAGPRRNLPPTGDEEPDADHLPMPGRRMGGDSGLN